MKKVNLIVKCCLINQKYEYNIKGILNKNKLIFFLDSDKMILSFDNLILERITNDLEITFDLKKQISFVKDKSLNKLFNLEIEVLELINKENYFKVLYKILNDSFGIEINVSN